MESVGFFRKKSPIAGVIVSCFLAFLLFCLLLAGFLARSAVSLLNNVDTAVTTLMEDKTFRKEISKTILDYAPEDSVTAGEINRLMNDEELSATIGEFSSIWVSDILDNGTDPVDALIDALKDRDMEDEYEDALDKAMDELDKDTEKFMKSANKLAKKYNFRPPEEGSSNLEIAIVILEGTREKVEVEIEEVVEYVTETQEIARDYSFLLSLFSTALFIVFNILLIALFYGFTMLLVRHLVKPCLYLGAPYLLVGILLLVLSALDIGSIVGKFVSIPENYLSIFDIICGPLFVSGLIALIIGIVLTGGSVAALILMKVLKKEPEAVPAVAGYQTAYVPAADEQYVPYPEQGATAQEPMEEQAAVQEDVTQEDAAQEASAEEVASTPVCPNCGEPVEGTLFCTNCGTRLSQ